MTRSGLLAIVATLTAAGCATAGVDTAADASPDTTLRSDATAVDAPADAAISACPSAATCAAATMLGSVSGDSGNAKLTSSGYQAGWVRVRVTEDNSGALGLTLRVAAKLTSPSGVNFDAFVYVNPTSDLVECATTTGTSTTVGNVEQTRVEWGEGTIANGSDDGRDVSIEIRPISGACAPGQTWQLEVEGNWS